MRKANSKVNDMTIIITVKDTDNIIGVKEQIASRVEDIVDIERVEVGMTYNEISKAIKVFEADSKSITVGKYTYKGGDE